jgi:predicted HTH domain antitoxin
MGELRMEMAVEQYRQEKISLSRAAELSGLTLWDFVARMKETHLELHYDESDLEQDLAAIDAAS